MPSFVCTLELLSRIIANKQQREQVPRYVGVFPCRFLPLGRRAIPALQFLPRDRSPSSPFEVVDPDRKRASWLNRRSCIASSVNGINQTEDGTRR